MKEKKKIRDEIDFQRNRDRYQDIEN